MSKGLIYVFSGNGKGKTSAALGTAMRAVGVGMRVAWVAFYKQESWGMGEVKSLRDLGVEVWLMGKGFSIKEGETNDKEQVGDKTGSSRLAGGQAPSTSAGRQDDGVVKVARVGNEGNVVIDNASEEEHKLAARQAMEKAEEILSSRHKSGLQDDNASYDLLILDEVNNAVAEGLIKVQEVLEVLEVRGGTHVVLTGRDVDPAIVEIADLVTECKKIKHPYDEGRLAVRGLDF